MEIKNGITYSLSCAIKMKCSTDVATMLTPFLDNLLLTVTFYCYLLSKLVSDEI